MKFALATLSAGMAALALTSAVSAAPTITLGLKYVGSAQTMSLDGGGFVDPTPLITGAGINPNANLQTLDLTQPSSQASTWMHFFAPTIVFSPDAGVTQRLRGLTFNISIGGNIISVRPDPTFQNTQLDPISSTTPDNTKYFGYSNVTNTGTTAAFSTNGDAGVNGDLQGITLLQSTASVATSTQVGYNTATNVIKIDGVLHTQVAPTPLGVFGVSFTQAGTGSIGISIATGLSFSYFNNGVATTVDGPSSATGTTITVGSAVPEPASLGVLAMGGLALLARRRKA